MKENIDRSHDPASRTPSVKVRHYNGPVISTLTDQ
jgi:hypothetical protein